MADSFPPAKQRQRILRLAEHLGSRGGALRRDECGDWRISGRKGHIYAVPEGFQIMLTDWSAKGWNAAKRALTFATVMQDGDDEGGLIMDRCPTPAEAEILRHWVGIGKKPQYSEEIKAQLRERMLAARQLIGQKTASDDVDG